MARVIERADAWRDTEDERGFSMALGRLGDPTDGDCLLVEAVQPGPDGEQVVAMLSLVPWGANGVSLDLMRRSPQSPTAPSSSWSASYANRPKALGSAAFR